MGMSYETAYLFLGAPGGAYYKILDKKSFNLGV